MQKELASPMALQLAYRVITSNVRRYGLLRAAFRFMGAVTSTTAMLHHLEIGKLMCQSALLPGTKAWVEAFLRTRSIEELRLTQTQRSHQEEVFNRVLFFLSNAIASYCAAVVECGVLDSMMEFMVSTKSVPLLKLRLLLCVSIM